MNSKEACCTISGLVMLEIQRAGVMNKEPKLLLKVLISSLAAGIVATAGSHERVSELIDAVVEDLYRETADCAQFTRESIAAAKAAGKT